MTRWTWDILEARAKEEKDEEEEQASQREETLMPTCNVEIAAIKATEPLTAVNPGEARTKAAPVQHRGRTVGPREVQHQEATLPTRIAT